MYTHLHEEIETLKLKVLKMVSLTEDAVQKSIQAYVNKDLYLAEEVQDGDVEVNRLEVEIDELALKLLALEQPVAGDLRFILGCMRISVDLERIADEAVNIASVPSCSARGRRCPFIRTYRRWAPRPWPCCGTRPRRSPPAT